MFLSKVGSCTVKIKKKKAYLLETKVGSSKQCSRTELTEDLGLKGNLVNQNQIDTLSFFRIMAILP